MNKLQKGISLNMLGNYEFQGEIVGVRMEYL